MRKVNRNIAGEPFALTNLHANRERYDNLILKIKMGGSTKVDNGVYGDETVKSALRRIYANLCFLCQKDIRARHVVEHFRPYNNFHPERAYDWNNLHLSCDKCNGEKIKDQYKKIDNSVMEEQYAEVGLSAGTRTKKIDDILLLDPTCDDVERLITFDFQTNEAVTTDEFHENALLTAQLLNQHGLPNQRSEMYMSLSQFCSNPEYFESWIRLKRIGPEFLNELLVATNSSDIKLADFCYRLALSYFSINKPFNMYMKSVFNASTHVSTRAIKHFARQHCAFEGIALPALVI
ncbi:HNH endonuclease [Vibrio splendidus]|uniref:HNH endonuclease n=1 Tax=Vibrio splendidus TaxID=29497 RepID=UPI000C84B9BA|nr:HNH endonuclease [Vibrio splendidus]PMO91675.1 hypothetical protein BCS97_21085 [Vibrio splendidus]PMP22931.1 hypothetical protein BCS89_16790 [Vibrio splendidus]PMP35373.1 hypothetical protein BCS88_09405 [Vibrio splendidus]PMP46418.1 hypothetical protein BCS85_15430 [Vibrio splendidus]PMP47105.1 hypothetical protein BCS87_21965 [Vibrio splendidus]